MYYDRIIPIKEELSIDIIGLAGACSYALDCIEAELVNIKNKHGKRVAYISIRMAEYWKIQGDELQDLAMCALLHDNALTQYISEELKKDSVINCKKDLSEKKTNLHCIYGEKNITKIPFKTDVSNVILYHHEHADGTGPFQKKWNEIPLFARIIHLADTIDIIGNNTGSGNNSWNFICQYLLKNRDGLFDSECVNAFFYAFPHSESFICLSDNSFEMKLWEIIPRQKQVFDWKTCKNVADFFAKIVDYKSSFTSRHSIEVAEKAAFFAQYIGYDSINVQKIYLAVALHDIGKMAVSNEILEKPDKLTDDEFSKMKNHAGYTYLILSEVNDFEEIRDWAAFHHEKLNGKGYPFGKTAAELNEPERIMACIDIGIAMIDEEHKQLFKYADEAYELLHEEFTPDKYDRIDIILENLRNYTVKHFSDEEQYMESINYKKIFTQKVQHQEFIHKLDEFMEHHNDEVEDQDEQILGILKYLTKWLVNHILYVDGQIPKG